MRSDLKTIVHAIDPAYHFGLVTKKWVRAELKGMQKLAVPAIVAEGISVTYLSGLLLTYVGQPEIGAWMYTISASNIFLRGTNYAVDGMFFNDLKRGLKWTGNFFYKISVGHLKRVRKREKENNSLESLGYTEFL